MEKTEFIIRQYLRDENNKPSGLLMAAKNENGVIVFGWSACGPRDKFNKKLGETIALNRLHSNKEKAHSFGYKIPKDITQEFVERATRILNK